MDPLDNPPNLPADKASPAKTPWDSETPSPKEWRACDAWTLGLLLINTKCQKDGEQQLQWEQMMAYSLSYPTDNNRQPDGKGRSQEKQSSLQCGS